MVLEKVDLEKVSGNYVMIVFILHIHSFIFIILIVDKSLDLSYGFIFLGEDSSSLSKKCAKSEC